MKYLQFLGAGALVTACIAAAPSAADPFGPVTVLGQEVRNTDSGGKTTDEVAIFNSPDDRVFDEKRFSVSQQGHGRAQGCTLIPIRSPVIVYTSEGTPLELMAVTGFSMRAHAETGSGLGRLGETAFMRCTVTGWLVRYRT